MYEVLVNRIKEPSTFAGFSGIALALGVSMPLYSAVTTLVAAVAGLVAVLMSEDRA